MLELDQPVMLILCPSRLESTKMTGSIVSTSKASGGRALKAHVKKEGGGGGVRGGGHGNRKPGVVRRLRASKLAPW